MNKTKLLLIAVVVLLILNISTLAFIFFKPHPSHQGPPNGEGPKKLIIERLRFDEDQQKQYEILIAEHRNKTEELTEKSRKLHDELYLLLAENNIDTAKSNIIIFNIADNQKAIENLNFDHFKKIKGLCKNDQLERFNGLVKELTRLFAPHGRPPK